MAATKVDPSKLPPNVLSDLQSLIASSKKEHVAIGDSYYIVYPTSATMLMEAMSEFSTALDAARVRKYEKLKAIDPEMELKNIGVSIRDLINDAQAGSDIESVLKKMMGEVDDSDMQKITVGQMFDALDKLIRINIDTLPPSFQAQMRNAQVMPDIVDDTSTNPSTPDTI